MSDKDLSSDLPRPSSSVSWRGILKFEYPFQVQAALGFGSGCIRKAPGTMGTLWAWGVWAIFCYAASFVFSSGIPVYLAWSAGFLVFALLFYFGCLVCARAASFFGVKDPGFIVFDEIWAFWFVLFVASMVSVGSLGFVWQFVLFVLFRFFDALKPWPVSAADRLFHDASGFRAGLGIMLDDFVAAVCVLLVWFCVLMFL